ncbi:NAD(P)/FAD-dependent oxidoreductase [Eubacteriales bacterium OttesenSCG-928-K08]|nr:NAD(P)/FAD-dependent oxidoreductase [Eubacteriales bacterium OttesenSCG-928-K08]
MKRVVVVGGGPAGLIAAANSAKRGQQTLLLEQNEKLGKKLYITGKGRCNLTNAGGRDAFFAHVVKNPRFLYSAWNAFDAQAIMNLLEEQNVPVKVERGDRVYPQSDKSSDVIRALTNYLNKCGASVQLNMGVKKIDIRGGRVCGVQTGEGFIPAEAVILCTGGKSYPSTGATGVGYRLARELGHDVLPASPSLIPLETIEAWPATLSGLALKNVTLRAYENEKKIFDGLGEMLFAHFGVTGPLVLCASAYMQQFENVRMEIDLKPGLTEQMLDARLLRDIEAGRRLSIKNAFSGLLPRALLPVVLELAEIDASSLACELTKVQRRKLCQTLKALPLTVRNSRPIDEAVVTRGGINVKEVNPKTMESKIVSGLFFAGEVLDVDALTGGYNLQIAWSTGALAGLSC